LSYLIDTNVLSELSGAVPNPAIAAWLQSLPLTTAYLSAITIAEIRRGITVTRDLLHRERLESWLADIRESFKDRILPIDEKIAEFGGALEGLCQRAGRPVEPFDALIAATAHVHGLTVVTRNIRDFEVWGGPVFNPWTSA
jgi:hypothetical protein